MAVMSFSIYIYVCICINVCVYVSIYAVVYNANTHTHAHPFGSAKTSSIDKCQSETITVHIAGMDITKIVNPLNGKQSGHQARSQGPGMPGKVPSAGCAAEGLRKFRIDLGSGFAGFRVYEFRFKSTLPPNPPIECPGHWKHCYM